VACLEPSVDKVQSRGPVRGEGTGYSRQSWYTDQSWYTEMCEWNVAVKVEGRIAITGVIDYVCRLVPTEPC